uniref:Putative secreted protein n=1 Tax=Anopheles darlingi TaxID=43151 RepID=A0A2M4D4T1_ANODA
MQYLYCCCCCCCLHQTLASNVRDERNGFGIGITVTVLRELRIRKRSFELDLRSISARPRLVCDEVCVCLKVILSNPSNRRILIRCSFEGGLFWVVLPRPNPRSDAEYDEILFSTQLTLIIAPDNSRQ